MDVLYYFVLLSVLLCMHVRAQNVTVFKIGVLATEGMDPPTSLFQLAADYVNYTSIIFFFPLLF